MDVFWKRGLRLLLQSVMLCGAGLAQTGAPAAPTPQVSIAIGTFACKVSACTYELGNGTADALATALLDTGRFSLYERENMAQLTEENVLSSSNPTQGFQGADVLIFGSITQLDTSGSSGGLCVFGVCLGSRDSVVGADLRIVDAKTRRVIAATHVEGKSSSNAASLNIPGLSLNNGQTSGVQAALGDMLKNAVNQLTQRIPASYYRTDAPAPVVAAAPSPSPAQAATGAAPSVPVAVSAPAPSFGWVNQFFFVDPATRQRACQEGFASATAGASSTVPGHAELISTEGRIAIDTSYGATFTACQAVGARAQLLPDSIPQQNFTFTVYNTAGLNKPDWVVALAFVDAAGTEMGRVDAIKEGKFDCNDYYSAKICTLVFTPDKISNATKAFISRADAVRILVNFGKGIETLTFSRSKYPTLQ